MQEDGSAQTSSSLTSGAIRPPRGGFDSGGSSKKKKITIFGSLVFLLVFIVAVFLIATRETPDLASTLGQSEQLKSEGKYAEEAKVWQDLLKNGDLNDSERVEATNHLGNAQFNSGNKDAAIRSYIESYVIQPNYGSALAVAYTAQVTDNNDIAIEYYEKAIGHLDPQSSLYEADKSSLEKTLEQLREST